MTKFLTSQIRETTIRPGDHVVIKRRLYTHHGICMNDGQIIHYAPPPGKGVGDGIGLRQVLGFDSGVNTIHITDLQRFIGEDHLAPSVVHYPSEKSYPPLKVMARARSRLGENGYNLWGNNCGHFSEWCKLVQSTDNNTLWKRIREGALMGLGTVLQTRNWAVVLAGTGLGVLTGAARYWLQEKKIVTSYDEFAAYASALYFGLMDQQRYPLGAGFRHAQQIRERILPALPEHFPDRVILFAYSGSLFSRPHRHDWLVTERGIWYPDEKTSIDFHFITALRTEPRCIMIETRNDERKRLPVHTADAASVCRFLSAAIAGTNIDAPIRINFAGRIKNGILRLQGYGA